MRLQATKSAPRRLQANIVNWARRELAMAAETGGRGRVREVEGDVYDLSLMKVI